MRRIRSFALLACNCKGLRHIQHPPVLHLRTLARYHLQDNYA
jgi:hypothetical protein